MYARPRHRFRGADCDSAVSLDDPTYLAEKVFFFFFFFFFFKPPEYRDIGRLCRK